MDCPSYICLDKARTVLSHRTESRTSEGADGMGTLGLALPYGVSVGLIGGEGLKMGPGGSGATR